MWGKLFNPIVVPNISLKNLFPPMRYHLENHVTCINQWCLLNILPLDLNDNGVKTGDITKTNSSHWTYHFINATLDTSSICVWNMSWKVIRSCPKKQKILIWIYPHINLILSRFGLKNNGVISLINKQISFQGNYPYDYSWGWRFLQRALTSALPYTLFITFIKFMLVSRWR